MVKALVKMFKALGPDKPANEVEKLASLTFTGGGNCYPVTTRVKIIEFPGDPPMMMMVCELGQFLIDRMPLSTRPYILQELEYHGVVWRIMTISAMTRDGSGGDILGQRLSCEPLRPA